LAELYLVEFRGSRKEYFFNTYYHSLKPTDYVIIQAERGEDIGLLSKKIDVEIDFDDSKKPRSILRRANDNDIDQFEELKQKENNDRTDIIELINKHNLKMKVIDVEWQYDSNKLTVYFTADQRVDFRELVKELAARFKTRIELRQIGVRDEARRLGGIGICGLQQCCNAFINDFNPISTQHARDQDLPLNPSKISGNCGRLLCCLRYETETYYAVKKQFPSPGSKVKTKMGNGVVERIDVFNEQAVVKDEEGVYIRAKSEDIFDVDKTTTIQPVAPSILEELDETDISAEEIKKLEDID
jgi:cell fate regulator YaaT (PSP1 superfamily)